ncbi:MAG TPA: hypothetical protein VHM88_06165 [Candidatus Acidoferrales bacterium]|nr:hypothetical protein [Candidatus Acidoferrales bacterium]
MMLPYGELSAKAGGEEFLAQGRRDWVISIACIHSLGTRNDRATSTLSYGYNLAGEPTSIQYPSGRTVQPNYDAIGRLSTVADTMGSTNTTYASGFSYNPAFEATGFNYGNGVAASFGYSTDRLQLTSLSYMKTGQTLSGLNYWYKQDSTNCPNGTMGNNGQIQCITDNVDSTRKVALEWSHSVTDLNCPADPFLFVMRSSLREVTNVTSQEALLVWDAQNGMLLQRLKSKYYGQRPPPSLESLSVSHEGRLVAVTRMWNEPPTGPDYELQIWDIWRGDELHSISNDSAGCGRVSGSNGSG